MDTDYTKPIELVHTNGSIKAATVAEDWAGIGAPPIWPDGSLFAVSENMLRRIGWRVRNV